MTKPADGGPGRGDDVIRLRTRYLVAGAFGCEPDRHGNNDVVDELFAKVAGELRARCGARLVVAFGSRARGTAGPDSDLDLCVVMDTALPGTERFVLVATTLQPLLGRIAVEPFVLTPNEYDSQKARGHPFLLDILREGRVLFDDGTLDTSVAAQAAGYRP